MRFEESGGMSIACGTEEGLVKLYDLRMSKPSLVKDHNSGE